MFFDKKCSIRSVSFTKVGGMSKRKDSCLYEDIECNFEEKRQARVMIGTDYAENADISKYIVVLPIRYNQVRKGQKIVLTDPVLGEIWAYMIETVQADQSFGWSIDCITLTLMPMKWQL